MTDFARSAHPGVQAQLDRLSMTSPLGESRVARAIAIPGAVHSPRAPMAKVAGDGRRRAARVESAR